MFSYITGKHRLGQWSPIPVRTRPAITALAVNVKLAGEAWCQDFVLSRLCYLENAFDHIWGGVRELSFPSSCSLQSSDQGVGLLFSEQPLAVPEYSVSFS